MTNDFLDRWCRYTPPAHCTHAEKIEIRQIIPAVEDALRPAGAVLMGRELARLAMALRHAAPVEAVDRKAQVALFVEFVGSEFPADVIRAACNEIIKTAVFFPAVAELRTWCEKLVAPRRRALHRLRELLRLPEPPPPETSEGRTARLARHDQIRAQFRSRSVEPRS